MTYSDPYQSQSSPTQDRFGFQLAARLTDAADNLPYDVSERLRAARAQALGKRRMALAPTASGMVVSGSVAAFTFGNGNRNWWGRFAVAAPLVALIAGLIVIDTIQNDLRVNELVEIDAALLTDYLPPTAYADPGFAQFLHTHAGQTPID